MKSIEFLTESTKMASPEHAAMLLQQNCKPFFAQAGWHETLYRGVEHTLKSFELYQNFGGRKPVTTNPKISAILDNWFLKNCGTKFRSNAIFAVGDPNVAASYGNLYAVFPIGDFTFCWSPLVRDMFIEVSDVNNKPITPEIEQILIDKMEAAEYQTTDLAGAIASDSEIMIACKQYYMLDVDMYHDVLDVVKGRR